MSQKDGKEDFAKEGGQMEQKPEKTVEDATEDVENQNETEETGNINTDTGSELGAAAPAVRQRILTDKGRLYEIEKIEHNFDSLNKLSVTINEMIQQKASFDSIRAKHSLWMDKYEEYVEKHQRLMQRIHENDKEAYIKSFEQKEQLLKPFRVSLENFFKSSSVKSRHQQSDVARSQKGRTSSRHNSSGSSSTRSSVSSKRLKEEQKRAELETRMQALDKKRKIELAKTQIKLDEEELKLSTDIAISDAKSKVLEKFENETEVSDKSGDSSVSFSFVSCENSRPNKADKVQNSKDNSDNIRNINNKPSLSVHAKEFIPKEKKVILPRHANDDTNRHDKYKMKYDDSCKFNTSVNEENDLASVVKHLRKPTPDIKRFGGNPLEFRKFYRQFQTRIVANAESEDEKMTYLEQFTYGEANTVVSGYSQLAGQNAYMLAMKQLEERYGNDEVIANCFVKNALEWPNIQPGDSKSLDDFSLFLIECKNAIESIDAIRILEYSENIKLLMKKLPIYLHDRWRNTVYRLRESKTPVRLSNFVEFVTQEAKKANDPVYGNSAISTSRMTNMKTRPTKTLTREPQKRSDVSHRNTFVTDLKNEKTKPDRNCTFCENNSHTLETCRKVLTLNMRKRYDHLRSKGHCFGCLKVGHMTKNCTNRLTCQICKRRHPTLLHDDDRIAKSKQEITTQSENCERSGENGKSSVSTTHIVDSNNQTGTSDISCAMAIIPVKVKLINKGPVIETYAFFDSGSSVSFCTETLLRKLGGSGKRMEIKLNTMGEPFSMTTFAVSGMQVMDLDMNNVIELPRIYTKDEIPVTKDHIPKQDEISKWSHLSDVIVPTLDCEIGLMIGNNIADAYTPFEVAIGPSGSPHATKTRLGWIVWNLVRDFNKSEFVANRAHLMTVQQVDDHSRLEELLKHSINLDFPERIVDDKRENSVSDQKFLEYVNQSVCFEDEHYTIGLPFRDQNLKFPNNELQHLTRMKGLKTKFAKDERFKRDYVEFMNKLLVKGYMEPVPKEEIDRHDGRVWYIPHHGVYHNKNPDKFRVVFDCSSMYMGVSLNKQLMQGPDLTNNLLGVLLRFREEKVAILGDIEAMFHQVKVPQPDRDCLRFYWWQDGNFENNPTQYRMTAHLFGATSSPSCCNFALKRTAEDFGGKYDTKVVETLTKDMYVDDCLSSVKSENEAILRIKDVTSLCKEGGFHMTKWISNVPAVIESVPEEERAKEVRQWGPEDGLPVERALGVKWFIETDELGFNVTISEKPATRRSILSITSSVYDPLGIVSSFVLSAKSLLQILCRKGLSWDTEITGIELKRWKEWLVQLEELKNVRLKRCYKPTDFDDVVSCQLHCFSDANDIGYGMVFYVRLIDNKGNIHCSFVLGKSRVAPLKKITVPRMELTAASTAVKLSKVICEQLNYDVNEIIFWTDSMSVIRYINNKDTRFHTFVANRLELIREATEPSQWRYVPTKLNPADYASRGMKVSMFDTKVDWLQGPDYLWQQESKWPRCSIDYNIRDDDKEVKHSMNISNTATVSENDGMKRLLSYFSKWNKLKRIVCRLLLVIDYMRKELLTQPLTLTTKLFDRAETAIIGYIQRQTFGEEIAILQGDDTNKTMKRSSALYRLDPFIGADGLLRVGGRLNNANIMYDAKHPVILPKESNVSRMIIEEIHRKIGHLGKNSILSELRKNYWIIGAGVIIKGIVSKCVTCRRYQAPFLDQKMADLPTERFTSDKPAFSSVGVDFFGPFYVKQRRSSVKQYGMIFTCMSIRAVHLEITHSMDTDSCINAIRRFIARRGLPELIRSDNGTNFVGAEREMREELQKWNLETVDNFMTQQGIKWEFNPPAASHFGGVWERLIRSVRKILFSIMQEQSVRLDDESLRTLFCEVEAILNNRPISDVSENVNDITPLTPNHLLLLKPGENLPPGTFCRTDSYAKRRWRQIQYLADIFWKRWTLEYLPMLQKRQKWISEKRNVKINDIVLVHDIGPRNFWNLGRIIEVFRDSSNNVRSVKVKTYSTVLTRPIAKLCLLLEADE